MLLLVLLIMTAITLVTAGLLLPVHTGKHTISLSDCGSA